MATSNTSNLLQCPITMDIFRDPVITPDGHTYERQAIEQWVREHGTSPMTREPLTERQIYQNRKVKECVEIFQRMLQEKKYQFVLDIDVIKKKRRPLFQTQGKTIFEAEWVVDDQKRPDIVILKIDGARARKEGSFYVDLTRHPHIVKTFGFVDDRNHPNSNSVLLLQEYAPQGSLYELLQERRTAPDEKVLVRIFLQIIEAMIYLTSNHVVHGDLACRNVLVFRFDEIQPEKTVVKITDFGLSRHSQLYSKMSNAAETILNIVPIRYAAPEILAANVTPDSYTEKSDVYSMGVLMWEAYSQGALPWGNIEDDNEVVRRVRKNDLLPQPSNCSQPFWSSIKRTWLQSPGDRPKFEELKHMLSEQYYRSGQIPVDKNGKRHERKNQNSKQDLKEETLTLEKLQKSVAELKDMFNEVQANMLAARMVPTAQKGLPETFSQHSEPQIVLTLAEDRSTPASIPKEMLKYPEIASLYARYDKEWVHGSIASRNRFGKDYTTFACAHPNILRLVMQYPNEEHKCNILEPRYW